MVRESGEDPPGGGEKNSSEIPEKIVPKFYQDTNQGPFVVWIQYARKEGATSKVPISPFKVGKLVADKYAGIISIEKIARFRVEVYLKTGSEANQLAQDVILGENGYAALIPPFRLGRKGLVKGIDTDITTQEIQNGVLSPYPVIGVERLNRKNKFPSEDNNDTWIPSETVVLTFEGQCLPTEVWLCKVRVEVEPYVTLPTMCFNCFRPGHSSKTCKFGRKCSMCGEDVHDGVCEGQVPRCGNCEGAHISTSRDCPVYVREKEIRRLMGCYNMSMMAARRHVIKGYQPTHMTKENFPEMRAKNPISYSNAVRVQQEEEDKSQKPWQHQQKKNESQIHPQKHTRTTSTLNIKQHRTYSHQDNRADHKKQRKHSPEKKKNYYKEIQENGLNLSNPNGTHVPRGGILGNTANYELPLSNRFGALADNVPSQLNEVPTNEQQTQSSQKKNNGLAHITEQFKRHLNNDKNDTEDHQYTKEFNFEDETGNHQGNGTGDSLADQKTPSPKHIRDDGMDET